MVTRWDDDSDDDELAAVLGRGDDSIPAGIGATDLAVDKAPPSWCGVAGNLVGDGILVLCRAVVRYTGTEPGPFVDPTKKARLDDALARQLAVWFPDAELPPWGEALMVAVAIAGGMKATGRPLPPKGPSAVTVNHDGSSAGTAGGTNDTWTSTPTPPVES